MESRRHDVNSKVILDASQRKCAQVWFHECDLISDMDVAQHCMFWFAGHCGLVKDREIESLQQALAQATNEKTELLAALAKTETELKNIQEQTGDSTKCLSQPQSDQPHKHEQEMERLRVALRHAEEALRASEVRVVWISFHYMVDVLEKYSAKEARVRIMHSTMVDIKPTHAPYYFWKSEMTFQYPALIQHIDTCQTHSQNPTLCMELDVYWMYRDTRNRWDWL